MNIKKIQARIDSENVNLNSDSNYGSIQEDLMLSVMTQNDILKLSMKINHYLTENYQIDENLILQMQGKLTAPLSIFSQKLSPLEAVVKYLKENLHLKNHQISKALERNDRSIWITYRNSKEKMSEKFSPKAHEIFVPINIFDKRLSILESLVTHLMVTKMISGTKVARLLNKSSSTIWTAKQRALIKLQGNYIKNA